MSTSTQISEIPSKKDRKTDNVEHDHISNLPNCVISHILSRLTTKDAVATSVLSKDWENKWTSVYNIHLVDRLTFKKEEDTFANFVERTLLLAQDMRDFRLFCDGEHDKDRMKTWVSAALSHNIHCLHIRYRHASFVLHHSPFNCYSLRDLELDMPCTLKVPATIGLPHLTTLRLREVEILNEVSNSDVVKFNFPILETLELVRCKWLNVKFVEIYAPKMTSFSSVTPSDASVGNYSIQITGGSLVNFESWGGLPENIVLTGGSDIVNAALGNCYRVDDLDYLEKLGLQVRKLLKRFLTLKDLVLTGGVAKGIALSKLGVSLPRYYKLKRLVVYISFSSAEGLFELLHAAPFLKILDIYLIDRNDHDYDVEENLPLCIISHLEEVQFRGFVGSVHEFKLAKFFLKNAVQLKSLFVDRQWQKGSPKKESYEIGQVLSTYPKASTCLTIVINGDGHVVKL